MWIVLVADPATVQKAGRYLTGSQVATRDRMPEVGSFVSIECLTGDADVSPATGDSL